MARQHFHTFTTTPESEDGRYVQVHDRLNQYLRDYPHLEVAKIHNTQIQKIGGREAVILVEFNDYSPLER